MEFALTFLGAFLGALLSLLATVFVENQKTPKLNFEIGSPFDKEGTPEEKFSDSRILRVRVSNKPVPRFLRWLDRAAAFHCTGDVQFHHENGAPVFSHPMQIRWSGSEAFSSELVEVGNIVKTRISIKSPDVKKMLAASWRDFLPGEHHFMDIAVRYDDEDDCFVLSMESFWSEIRNPDLKLPKGRFLVKVTIHFSGNNMSQVFALENSVSKKDFRLTTTSREEAHRLRS